MLAKRAKKDAPDQGGWHIAPTTLSNGLVFHPLISFATDTACGSPELAGLALRRGGGEAEGLVPGRGRSGRAEAASEALHRRLWEFVPFVITGQFQAPYAWRSNVEGVVDASVIVFWNIAKK
jgi:peptide/nickel transport system substrate-binding protein